MCYSYKTPKLIATTTPAFSFLSIWRFQRIRQGNMANVKSMVPEYAVPISLSAPSFIERGRAIN